MISIYPSISLDLLRFSFMAPFMNTFYDDTWPLKNLKWIFFFHKMHEHSVKLTKYFKHTLSAEIVKFSYKYFEANCNLVNITLNSLPHTPPVLSLFLFCFYICPYHGVWYINVCGCFNFLLEIPSFINKFLCLVGCLDLKIYFCMIRAVHYCGC